jgi:spermidine synthase
VKKNLNSFIIWSIVGTGISSIVVQLVTIREFLSQFHGNEITVSLVLFSWLLLTGLGSLAAKPFRRFSLGACAVLTGFLALWPLPQLIFIRYLREILFVHGEAPGFYEIFFFILAVTAPYCLLAGFVLPYALGVLRGRKSSFSSGQLYITDNIGDVIGGVLFSFFLVYWFKPFKGVALASSLLLAASIMILLFSRKYVLFFCIALLAMPFYFFSMNQGFEKSTLSKQYGRILRYVESPYGRIVVTKEGPQHTFWESGIPLYSDAEIINSEEKVHYPLCQLDEVKSVLLLSGGLGQALQEVSKYHPDRVDYVELDPNLTGVAQELGFIKGNASLSVINTDGREYVKRTKGKYDAIIIDLPDPDTFQLNRFYTREFLGLAKSILRKGGVLSFSIEYSPNYISPLQKRELSILYRTAKEYFRKVLILPGERAFFLCRDGELSADVPARLSAHSITTAYVGGFYYGNVTKERIEEMAESLDPHVPENTDFEPRIMRILFQEWFLKHGTSPKFFIAILVALTCVYLLFIRKEEYILFSTGVANMGAEMLVLFTFQVMFGYLYLKVGAIITAFLMGLLPGAALGNLRRKAAPRQLVLSDLFILALLLTFYFWITFFETDLHPIYFLAYGFVFSLFCGYQFPLVTALIGEKESPAAGCLAADLTGAAVGTLATGALLIPLLGIHRTIIFLILVKISSNIILLFIKGRRGAWSAG